MNNKKNIEDIIEKLTCLRDDLFEVRDNLENLYYNLDEIVLMMEKYYLEYSKDE